jgi:hypothetical protein
VIEEKAISPNSNDLKLLLLETNKRTPFLGDVRGLLLGDGMLFDGGVGCIIVGIYLFDSFANLHCVAVSIAFGGFKRWW